MDGPRLIDQDFYVDDRGTFQNIVPEFTPIRVYMCRNFATGTVRGYHYHKIEKKIFVCLQGAVKFAIRTGDINYPLSEPKVFVLSAQKSQLLYVPAECANAWQTLTDDTIILGMSNVSKEESVNDDIRLDPLETPKVWEVKWR